jgi:hypothetical protein
VLFLAASIASFCKYTWWRPNVPAIIILASNLRPSQADAYKDTPKKLSNMGLRRQQLEACLHKNWLQKRRNLRVTLCEVLSPLVLILLLSYGYFQSDILSFNAKIYAQLDFDIPNDFSAFLPGGKAYGGESLDDEEDAEAASESRGTDIVRLNKIRKFIEDLLKGPLPAPTFDQFVLLSTAVSSGVDADLYNELIGVSESALEGSTAKHRKKILP